MKTCWKTAVAMGVVVLSSLGSANANSLLFPYFTTSSGAQSIVNIVSNGQASSAEKLHYVYNYGALCVHFDATGTMSQNDVLQHSIAAPFAGGSGKVVGSDTSTPVYFPVANQQGFLVVSTRTSEIAQINGDMTIIDPNSGLVASYAAISNGVADTTGWREGDFSGIADQKFDLSFLNPRLAQTSWYAVVTGNMYGVINSGSNWLGSQILSNGGAAYDNDGLQVPGYKSKQITCAGSFTPNDLLTPAQYAATAVRGGLVHATASNAGGDATGLVLMKMQTVRVNPADPFSGKSSIHREAGQVNWLGQ